MSISSFSSKFKSLEHFTDVVREWDIDFLQIDRGTFNANLKQLINSTYLFGHCCLNRTFEQRGSAPPNKWTFALFSESSPSLIWRKKDHTNNAIVLYGPGSEINCISKPGFEVFTCSYSEQFLDDIGEKLGLSGIARLAGQSDSYECASIDLSDIRAQLTLLTKTMQGGTKLLNHKALNDYLENELPEQLLALLFKSQPKNVASRRQGVKAINKIKEYLAEQPNDLLNMRKLCEIAKASERTLQYAFKEYYGVPPSAYVKAYRLHGAHRALRQSSPSSTKVIDIANEWSFWHMGQFASDYHKLFGELPSETLKKQ